MNKETIEILQSYGCEIEDMYHKTISHIEIHNMCLVKSILQEQGYQIIDARSSETTLVYKASPRLFRQITEKYDLSQFFDVIECFAEISKLQETSKMGSGAIWSQSNECGFHFAIDFANHQIETLHFGDERTIVTYNGQKCFIDEINCSDIEKKILESIWTLEEERERIRHLPSNQASKKVVEYRKLLQQWNKVLNVISEDWKQSTLIFGKKYSIERDIEYWEKQIRNQTAKLLII